MQQYVQLLRHFTSNGKVDTMDFNSLCTIETGTQSHIHNCM